MAVKRKYSILDIAAEHERRQRAKTDDTQKRFIKECRNAEKQDGYKIEDAIRTVKEIKNFRGVLDLHTSLIDIITEIIKE